MSCIWDYERWNRKEFMLGHMQIWVESQELILTSNHLNKIQSKELTFELAHIYFKFDVLTPENWISKNFILDLAER